MRIDLEIPADTLDSVDDLARRQQWTRAEVVERALIALLAEPEFKPRPSQDEVEAVLERVGGSWKHKNLDGLVWQRKLRAEWDDDAIVE